jgi:hypothetical protein
MIEDLYNVVADSGRLRRPDEAAVGGRLRRPLLR